MAFVVGLSIGNALVAGYLVWMHANIKASVDRNIYDIDHLKDSMGVRRGEHTVTSHRLDALEKSDLANRIIFAKISEAAAEVIKK